MFGVFDVGSFLFVSVEKSIFHSLFTFFFFLLNKIQCVSSPN